MMCQSNQRMMISVIILLLFITLCDGFRYQPAAQIHRRHDYLQKDFQPNQLHTKRHIHIRSIYRGFPSTVSLGDSGRSSFCLSGSTHRTFWSTCKDSLHIVTGMVATALLPQSAIAATTTLTTTAIKDAKIKGWDLYGRVPYDDWLFTNDKLLDPNLLKPSIVEAVVAEMPYNYHPWMRRRFIKGMVQAGVLATLGFTVLATLAYLSVLGIRWYRKDLERFAHIFVL